MPIQNVPAVKFNAENEAHRRAYLEFVNTGKWNTKFSLEFPFTSIPAMAMYRLAEFACKAEGQINNGKAFLDHKFVTNEFAEPINQPRLKVVSS